MHPIYAGLNSDHSISHRDFLTIVNDIQAAYAQGKTNIMFDCFSEAFWNSVISRIQSIVKYVKDSVPNAQFFFLTGDLKGEEAYNTFLEMNNEEPLLKIVSMSYFEAMFKSSYGIHTPQEYMPGLRDKKFLCFNKVHRQHRIELLEEMFKYNLVDQAYYSFQGSEPSFIDNIIEYKDNFPYCVQNINRLPLKLNINSYKENPVNITQDDWQYFNNSYFSVVTETMYRYYPDDQIISPGCFFSEKIFKPLAMKHPFIVVGTSGYLSTLRERGYKTFAPYIDESYDMITSPKERMDAIVNEIRRLCSLSDDEMIQWTHDIKHIVEHNADILKNEFDFTITKDLIKYFTTDNTLNMSE